MIFEFESEFQESPDTQRNPVSEKKNSKVTNVDTREMAQQLRVMAVLPV